MKNFFTILFAVAIISANLFISAKAGTHGKNGQATAKSIGAGALSLLVWPGIGQAVNGNKYEKNMTHALLGLTVVFRFWSCYDAVANRSGGVWHNRI